ncbi:MAG: Grx4 family monothiol glutaredoxin, partial [Myxococcota bacterium]
VVLFMKGTRMFPQCGFSARAVDIFKRCGVTFHGVNVLADGEIRQGIKDFSQWPTIPQAYVRGEFIGGSDIILEMYENGELQQLLGVDADKDDDHDAATPPKLVVTGPAREALAAALRDAGPDQLRFDVTSNWQYELYFGSPHARDFAIDCEGLTVHVPRASAARLDGATIDFIDGPDGKGFKIDNPNEPPSVKTMTPGELKRLLDAGESIHVFDVRGANEREIAKIEPSTLLDAAGREALAALDDDARIVLYCHHGVRSRSAAEQLLQEGYTKLFNLTGGIDAWSAEVDPSVPRY